MRIILFRGNCLECSGGSRNVARDFRMKGCALWPWRLAEATERAKKDKDQLTLFELMTEVKA